MVLSDAIHVDKHTNTDYWWERNEHRKQAERKMFCCRLFKAFQENVLLQIVWSARRVWLVRSALLQVNTHLLQIYCSPFLSYSGIFIIQSQCFRYNDAILLFFL